MTTKLRAASFQDGAVTSAKIAANAITNTKIADNAVGSSEIDLTASYAFTGTVSGTSDLVKVASSTTSQTSITAFTLDLPTTDDFSHLKCFIHGVGVSGSEDSWSLQARDASDNSYRTGGTDYRFMFSYGYVNTTSSASGITSNGDTNGSSSMLIDESFVGTYGDIGDLELEIDIFNNRGTGIANHSPRFYWRKQAQKRNTDEWTYHSFGSGAVIPFIEINQFKLFRSGSNTFTIYGYELYKVK